jgi:hypothetical protein
MEGKKKVKQKSALRPGLRVTDCQNQIRSVTKLHIYIYIYVRTRMCVYEVK